MNVLYMHSTTFEYLKNHPDMLPAKQMAMIDGIDRFGFDGISIVTWELLRPTINEQPKGGWIFPKERFVTYESSDEEWCRYFKIGREARGFILGEIIGIDSNFIGKKPKGRTTIFNPERMK